MLILISWIPQESRLEVYMQLSDSQIILLGRYFTAPQIVAIYEVDSGQVLDSLDMALVDPDPLALVDMLEGIDEVARLLRQATSLIVPSYDEELVKHLTTRVHNLELSVRTANRLTEYDHIIDLAVMTEAQFWKMSGFGRKSINELKEVLAVLGLWMGMHDKNPNIIEARRRLSFKR